LVDICSYGIINGRGFTAEEKQRLVAASFASGLSVRDFAAQEGIGYSTLNKWRRRYGKLTDTGPGFVPVAVGQGNDDPGNPGLINWLRQRDIFLAIRRTIRNILTARQRDRHKTGTAICRSAILSTPFVQGAVPNPVPDRKFPNRHIRGITRGNKALLFFCRQTAPVDNAITTYVDQILIS
jgi:hypothetical protein